MVQVFDASPTESSASLIGKALGTGVSKQMALADAENAFQQAGTDPMKLATAFARLTSSSPEMARGAGPMYQAMLQKMQGDAMAGMAKEGEGPQPFPFPTTQPQEVEGERETITKTEDVQSQIEGYVPPTKQQIVNEAGNLWKQNPAMFAGDPNKAIEWVQDKYNQLDKIAQAKQQRHQTTTKIQDDVVDRLRNQVKNLGVTVPARVISDIEQDAIDFVKKGGTEEEAMRKYGDELDETSRKYQQIKDIGKRGLITDNEESISSLKSLQKDFKKRGDLRNFADTIVADLKTSYPVAYAIADPISDHPALGKYVNALPEILSILPGSKQASTEKIVPELAKLISEDNASPQSVFYHLNKKGYDALVLKSYLDKNRDKLDLKSYQSDQLGKEVQPTVPFLNDIFMEVMGGVE